MMPGHIPPGGPYHQGRKQMEHPYQQYHYAPPPQTHSPVYHNPYAPYHHPQHYGPPHGYPHQMPHMQQWNPYHQPQPQPQYNMPPRQFQPQASPVVVSSHPHMAGMAPVNRSLGQTPPIVHSHTPPVQRIQTPQRAPSSPSVHSQVQMHSPTPPAHTTVASPPPVAETKPVPAAPPTPPQPSTFKPFCPPLPWLSVPEADFPPRAAGRRRRKRGTVSAQEQGLALPSREQNVQEDTRSTEETGTVELESAGEPEESQASTIAAPSDAEVDTPSTSHPPSEIDIPAVQQPTAQTTAPAQKHARNTTKPAVPLIPIKPAKPTSAASTTQKSVKSPPAEKPQAKSVDELAAPVTEAASAEEAPKPAAPAAPKSWAELLRAKNAAAAPQAQTQPQSSATTNGTTSTNGPVAPKSNSLADVLASYSVDAEKKVSFIEPRGLVNTGNLCYMNSVSHCLPR
jgi:ubiquitin carboxyl-terminal hydrolase 10